MDRRNQTIIIGYSGHAYVVLDILHSQKIKSVGYCELTEKKLNPYNLSYFGHERDQQILKQLQEYQYFVAIGANQIRRQTLEYIEKENHQKAINAIHNTAFISNTATLKSGIMIGGNVQVNAMCTIGKGVICNTSCVIEHECVIGEFSHIAPGAVLCGNVTVGQNSFIGARAVVKEGVVIGENVVIGAGAVIISDIPNNGKVVGNPQRFL